MLTHLNFQIVVGSFDINTVPPFVMFSILNSYSNWRMCYNIISHRPSENMWG